MADVENPQRDEPQVLNTMQARQGRRGRHALWVLVISMGLIVAIYAVMVGGVFGGRLSKPGGQTTVDQTTLNDAKGFHAEPAQPRQSENPQTAPTITPQGGSAQSGQR